MTRRMKKTPNVLDLLGNGKITIIDDTPVVHHPCADLNCPNAKMLKNGFCNIHANIVTVQTQILGLEANTVCGYYVDAENEEERLLKNKCFKVGLMSAPIESIMQCVVMLNTKDIEALQAKFKELTWGGK